MSSETQKILTTDGIPLEVSLRKVERRNKLKAFLLVAPLLFFLLIVEGLNPSFSSATAPRGRSIYAHLPKSHFGQSKFLYTMEKQRLKRLGVPFLSWQNRWIRGYAMSLPTIALFWYAGAWTGIACMALIWLISNFELEALNYLEHYGLIRETGSPIDYRHSWDNSTLFTSWFFIEIGRQADHHDRGETHFWELDEVGAPNCGNGYFTLFALALFPPLFHKYMEKQLEKWDNEEASEGELKIAKEMNAIAGYNS